METARSSVELLIEKAEAYGKTTYELTKLKLLETTTVAVSSLVARLFILMMISMCTLILSIGIALLLGDALGKSFYGFAIVAVFYLITGIVLHFFLYKWIKKPVSEIIIKQVLQ